MNHKHSDTYRSVFFDQDVAADNFNIVSDTLLEKPSRKSFNNVSGTLLERSRRLGASRRRQTVDFKDPSAEGFIPTIIRPSSHNTRPSGPVPPARTRRPASLFRASDGSSATHPKAPDTPDSPPALDFESLVDQHYQGLYSFACSLCKDTHRAADLTQQAFYKAMTKSGQLKKPSSFKSWLYTILYRDFLGNRRKASRHPEVDIEDAAPELPAEDLRLDDHVDGQLALHFLSQLGERHRVPLTLFYLNAMSYEDIARLLNIPKGTVMSRLSRGKKLLRRLMESNPESGLEIPSRSVEAPTLATAA